jgi:hypothetical protein
LKTVGMSPLFSNALDAFYLFIDVTALMPVLLDARFLTLFLVDVPTLLPVSVDVLVDIVVCGCFCCLYLRLVASLACVIDVLPNI